MLPTIATFRRRRAKVAADRRATSAVAVGRAAGQASSGRADRRAISRSAIASATIISIHRGHGPARARVGVVAGGRRSAVAVAVVASDRADHVATADLIK